MIGILAAIAVAYLLAGAVLFFLSRSLEEVSLLEEIEQFVYYLGAWPFELYLMIQYNKEDDND
jgi:hypothetical protein